MLLLYQTFPPFCCLEVCPDHTGSFIHLLMGIWIILSVLVIWTFFTQVFLGLKGIL